MSDRVFEIEVADSDLHRTMNIHLLCKRYYTNKDLLNDRFGRLYHLPVQLAQLDARDAARLAVFHPGRQSAVAGADPRDRGRRRVAGRSGGALCRHRRGTRYAVAQSGR